MTTGLKLKSTLGLKDFKTVYVSRLILPHTQKVIIVYYNSLRKDSLFSKRSCVTPPLIGMAYSGKDLAQDKYKLPTQTPLMGIETWNGDLNNYIVFTIDVAYNFRLNKKDYSKLPESIQQAKPLSIFLTKEKLKELSLFDLAIPSNTSDLTMKFRKDRQSKLGGENTQAKLVDCFINEKEGSVTFAFLTTVTPYEDESYKSKGLVYKKNPDYKEADPDNDWVLSKNRSKTYELQIKILNVLEWIKAFEGSELSPSDLKKILEISDVQLSNTSPAFNWQGFDYWLSQLDAAIYPQTIKPQRWDKYHGDGEAFLDKHFSGLLSQIKFFLNPMTSMLNKKLKNRGLLK